MSNVTIAVDTAKNVFGIAISPAAGQVRERRRMTRNQFKRFWTTREPCRVVMEGCSGSHHWARLLIGLGFEVKLIPPHYERASHHMAERSDRRWGKAVNKHVPSRPLQRLAHGARIPGWLEPARLHTRVRMYTTADRPLLVHQG